MEPVLIGTLCGWFVGVLVGRESRTVRSAKESARFHAPARRFVGGIRKRVAGRRRARAVLR